MEKINCVLLVDDRPSTNFFNKRIISLTNNVDHVEETQNGKEALDFILKNGNHSENKAPKPNIIFLDINMPVMNGFEFLENFNELTEEITKEVVIVLLTTSNWQKDQEKASKLNVVHDFIEKPLNIEKFNKIAAYYNETYVK